MAAGDSARVESATSRLLADEYRRLADDLDARSDRFALAHKTEARVAYRLAVLGCRGWEVLEDRRWPGTRHGNVDLVAIGPGGVLVIDVKAWQDVRVEDGRLYRGDDDCEDALAALLAVTERVEESLADVGLPPLEVLPVLVFAGAARLDTRLGRVHLLGENDLAPYCQRRGHRLDTEQVAAVHSVLDRDFPPYHGSRRAASPVVPAPVLPAAVTDEPALFDIDEVVAADLAAALAAPLAEWMTWLHPEQARFVRRGWNGPARVAGPAGTGKTVLGLHRAAYLAATRPGRLLFVTYVKTLPKVLASYYARLSPETVDRVEFTGLHGWAFRLLRERGVTVRIDRAQADALFDQALGEHGGGLVAVHADPAYWRDEVQRVVKGRGLTTFDEYAALDRVGRRTRLVVEQRRAVWDVYERYTTLLREHRLHDFDDVLALALAEVCREPFDPPYAAVVVDEVQDLTCVGVRLLHAVAGDRPDALLLIGDGRQAVFPGGFRFIEAGVGIAGRSVVLRTNYRNAGEILRVAEAVGAEPVEDDPEVAAEARAARDGGRVLRVEATTRTDHDARLLAALRGTLRRPDVTPDEVAVLAADRATVGKYVATLLHAGIACVDLLDCDATPDGRVRVGTFKRAKGLEFKYVFLPLLDRAEPPRQPGEHEAAYRERCEVARREVHVGMTRARDGLWLGYVDAAAARTA